MSTSFELMLICSNANTVSVADQSGVDFIFVDLENLGKKERQPNRNTWISNSTIDQVASAKSFTKNGKLLVRINPPNPSSRDEINRVISYEPDIIMLPYFHSIHQLNDILTIIDGRVPLIPLIETRDSLAVIDEIASMHQIKNMYIGLNDLSIDCGYGFMFEPLANGMIDHASGVLNAHGVKWGFGGLARVGEGLVPAEVIIGEIVRLKASYSILSRTFSREFGDDLRESNSLAPSIFSKEVEKIKHCYNSWMQKSVKDLLANSQIARSAIRRISSCSK